MPDAPAATPVVVWVLSIIVLALLGACGFLFGFAWRRVTKRPEEVLRAARTALTELEKRIAVDLAEHAARLDEFSEHARAAAAQQQESTTALHKDVSQFRADLRVLEVNVTTIGKRQQEHTRWIEGVVNDVQVNREDIQIVTGAVGVLQEEAGKTPLPRKMPQRPRVGLGRGRAPIPLPPPDDDEDGGR